MRAYQIKQNLDNLDQLRECLTELPDPKPAENQVLVDVKCAGMNFFDTLQVRGLYQDQPPFPFIPGAELSGVISEDSPIPKGCPFVPGKTRVFGSTQGCYTTKASVAWKNLIEIPPGLDFEHSAAIFITYPTSYASLINRGKLKKGEWCLVHAAAGGVGIAAVQIAKAVGARVIATASSQEKLEFVRKYGGLSDKDFTLVYDDTPASSPSGAKKRASMLQWQAQVLKITQGKGVDVVFDPVGLINKSLKVAAWDCRLVVVGFAGGQIDKVPANLLLLKNATVTGIFWGAQVKKEPEEPVRVWAALLELISRGQIRPVLHTKIYNGLEALPDGLKDLNSRKVLAKAILRIHPHPQSKL